MPVAASRFETAQRTFRSSPDQKFAAPNSQRGPRVAIARCRQPSADDLVTREKLRDFDRRGLGSIRTMHRILADRLRVDLADGAVGCLRGVGGAHDIAMLQDGV